eukprot:7808822-Alexandrium_andersonii.AAC.1
MSNPARSTATTGGAGWASSPGNGRGRRARNAPEQIDALGGLSDEERRRWPEWRCKAFGWQ